MSDRQTPMTAASLLATSLQQRPAGIPRRVAALVTTLARDRGERLEDDPVGQGCGDVSVVVGRADFHDVHSDHGQLQTDSPYGVEELSRRETTGLGRSRARSVARIAHVDVDRQEDAVTLVRGDL